MILGSPLWKVRAVSKYQTIFSTSAVMMGSVSDIDRIIRRTETTSLRSSTEKMAHIVRQFFEGISWSLAGSIFDLGFEDFIQDDEITAWSCRSQCAGGMGKASD